MFWLLALLFLQQQLLANDTVRFKHNLEQALVLTSQNPDSAINIAQRILDQNNTLMDKRTQKGSHWINTEANFVLGEASRYSGNIQLSLKYLYEAYSQFLQMNDKMGQAKSLHAMGNDYLILGEFSKAKSMFLKAINIKREINDKEGLGKSFSNLGIAYFRTGAYDSAVICQNNSLKIKESLNDSAGMANAYSNLGNIHLFQAEYPQAIDHYKNALACLDTQTVTRKLASLTNNIGNIYNRQGQYSGALKKYQKAIAYYHQLNDKQGAARSLNNAGLIQFELKNYTQAQQYHQQALSLFKSFDDQPGIADTYGFLGNVFYELDQKDNARRYYLNSLSIEQRVGDKNGVANCYQNLGLIYKDELKTDSAKLFFNKALNEYITNKNSYAQAVVLINLAGLYFQEEAFGQGINAARQSYNKAKMYNGLREQIDALELLAKGYQAVGSFYKAYNYLQKAYLLNDSLLNIEKTEKLLKLETRYKIKEKEQAIKNQNLLIAQRDAKLDAKEVKIKTQKKIRNTLIIAAIILSIFIVWLWRVLQINKKANFLLVQQKRDIIDKNEELIKLNEEIETQRGYIEDQNIELILQNDNANAINEKMAASIHYAEYIKQAVLPGQKKLDELFNEHFVLNLPKDIVGGDFYWVFNRRDEIFVVVGDCTGHGVPGGFLSMLGISFLKEIVALKDEHEPKNILHQLREKIITTLHQTGELLEPIDGIDMALLRINTKEKTLDFAGGRSNLILINKQELHFYKGDFMTLGYCIKMDDFTTHHIKYTEGDSFYLYTDGFIDQFNEDNEKFGKKRFLQLVNVQKSHPLKKQREIFFHTFMDWKGNWEQIDDALVFAAKL